jgi:hypothetical protein
MEELAFGENVFPTLSRPLKQISTTICKFSRDSLLVHSDRKHNPAQRMLDLASMQLSIGVQKKHFEWRVKKKVDGRNLANSALCIQCLHMPY